MSALRRSRAFAGAAKPERPLVLAHRGDTREAVENTLPAFVAAMAARADGVELDVRPCKSGQLVVFHDPHIFRMTGEGLDVAALSLAELRARDLGRGAGPPLLDEALDLVLGAGGIVNVEAKGDVPDRRALARELSRSLSHRRAEERERIVVSTFSPRLAAALRLSRCPCDVALLLDEGARSKRWGDPAAFVLGVAGIHPHDSLVSPSSVARWRSRGLFVGVWTVNDPARAAELARLGVDILVTDDVPAIRAAI